MKTPRSFAGTWRITETEVWDLEELDDDTPASMTFGSSGVGRFEMLAVRAEVDARFDGNRVEFTWAGHDDGSEVSGRGWAKLGKDGRLRGRIYFHLGDESSFVAQRKK
jgi:hypothetical protein